MPRGVYKKTEKHKRKIRESQTLRWKNPEYKKNQLKRMKDSGCYFKKGHKINLGRKTKGWKWSEESKNNFSKLKKENPTNVFKKGKENPNWAGGKSFEPYGLEFNEDLKEVIRNRDRRKCFMCKIIELECGELLSVHHIDYNKKNNDPQNLISLCRKCHFRTNKNRKHWINYFKNNL